MLVAMALTLLMMAAVIGVFATVSSSVANRRATMEMSGQLRHVRTVLQDDLANATCPTIPDVRPESNHGYLEIIEGPMCDFDPSIWLRDENNDGEPDPVFQNSSGDDVALDLAASQLPGTSLDRLPGSSVGVAGGAVTDGGALGDWDDVLMLTVRNDNQPFVGRVPNNVSLAGEDFQNWDSRAIESQLAEVIWFAVENPVEENKSFYFGEPGFRTVYRRALLIAPWLDYGITIDGVKQGSGVLRVMPNTVDADEYDEALAGLIAFQEQYDLSVRLVWDPLLGSDGRWVIKANTLADLTKRENRAEHGHPASGSGGTYTRSYPHRSVSGGRGVAKAISLRLQADPRARPSINNGGSDAVLPVSNDSGDGAVSSGRRDAIVYSVVQGGSYANRPVVNLDDSSIIQPTIRAVLSENGEIVMFTNGMVPLSGARRGEDVMLSSMLAFDLKVYDPEAPVLATDSTNYPGDVVAPDSPAWGVLAGGYLNSGVPTGTNPAVVSRGAYVDLGYLGLHAYFAERNPGVTAWPAMPDAEYVTQLLRDSAFGISMNPRSRLGDDKITFDSYEFQPYRTYDTWSYSYENNGLDDDADGAVDQATDGIDNNNQFGVDDPSEREAPPPYDTPLRGVQVTLRAYELDSRSIREVNVKQTFVPK